MTTDRWRRAGSRIENDATPPNRVKFCSTGSSPKARKITVSSAGNAVCASDATYGEPWTGWIRPNAAGSTPAPDIECMYRVSTLWNASTAANSGIGDRMPMFFSPTSPRYRWPSGKTMSST
ncbi:hypothetical protein [Streptosporangium sp. NPDC004631]